MGTFLHSIDPNGRFLTCPPPIAVAPDAEAKAWDLFLSHCGGLSLKKGAAAASMSSNAFSKFVRERSLLTGVVSATGRADTVFSEAVRARGVKHGAGAKRMTFECFLRGLAGIMRIRGAERDEADADLASAALESL